VAVRQRANDFHRRSGGQQFVAAQHGTELLNALGGPARQVGEGSVLGRRWTVASHRQPSQREPAGQPPASRATSSTPLHGKRPATTFHHSTIDASQAFIYERGKCARFGFNRRDGRHQPPESGDFYISKAGTFACAVYRRRGADADAWVTYPDEQARYAPARWVQRQLEETGKPVALRASSMLMHLEAIRAGAARGVLPCYVGDDHPLLERLTPPIPEIAAEYWIIVHRDLRRAACVRAVIDWVKALFAEQRGVIDGVP
jgi:LysR substrate binding domain-containing protein